MLTERKTKSGLVIVGDLIDVEKYMSVRGVVNGVDPATGMRVEYGGKKRIGTGKSTFGDSWESNPYIRYGDEFRMAGGVIRSVNGEKAINPDQKLEIAGVANANVIDRMDERLEPAGCDTGHFINNNILLADHMYYSDFAIGLVTGMDAKDSGVEFQAHIGDPTLAPLTERQRNIRSLVAQKCLKTVSVGFIPHKIRAPEYDQNGGVLEPAVILLWEMLELSIVAIPCNPGATFQQRSVADQHRKKIFQIGVSFNASNDAALTTNKNVSENINIKQSDEKSSTQTLIFLKEKFTQADAVKWASENEYRSDKVDETETSFRLRQKETDEFIDGSFKTIELTDGIQAVIGRLKTTEETGVDGMDKETAQALIDQMKAVATAVTGLVDTTKDNGVKLDAIAAKLDTKPAEKPEETPPAESEGEKRIKSVETALKAATDSIAKMDDVMGKILEKLCATAA